MAGLGHAEPLVEFTTVIHTATSSPQRSSGAWAKLWRSRSQADTLVFEDAKTLLRIGDSLGLPSDVLGHDDGSLALAFYAGERCVEVRVERDEGLTLFDEIGLGFDFQEEVVESASMEQAGALLEQLSGGRAWSLSGLSSQVSGTITAVASGIRPSRVRPGTLRTITTAASVTNATTTAAAAPSRDGGSVPCQYAIRSITRPP